MWIEEWLLGDFEQKSVPIGVNYYLNDKLVLILTEESKATLYRGKSYTIELWYCVFFPIEKIKQSFVCAQFPFLENHPGKKDALYLAAETEDFESLVKSVLREINKKNPLFGISIPETNAEKKARLMNEDQEVDTNQPRTFHTGPASAVKKPVAKKPSLKPKKIKANKKSENNMMIEILKRRVM